MKYIVIGLGNFGSALAIELSNYGHEVIGVDVSESRVNAMNDRIASVFQLDATERDLLRMLPLEDIDGVIVTIGENFGSSIQIIAQLRHLKVDNIYARAFNETHEMVLESLNIEHILTPETDAAGLIAATLFFKGVISSLKIDEEYYIIRIKTPGKFVGFTCKEINLYSNFKLKLISVSSLSTKKNLFGISGKSYVITDTENEDYKIQEQDILTIYGNKDNFIKLGRALN